MCVCVWLCEQNQYVRVIMIVVDKDSSETLESNSHKHNANVYGA